MRSSPWEHILITGSCGAGKTTLAMALSHQLQMPLRRLDDNPTFRRMLPQEPWSHRETNPELWAQWQALRRSVGQEAIRLQEPHIIEGTHLLTAPELTAGHRRILVDTPLHQIVRQFLARDRARYKEDPLRYADRNAGAPGSALARQRATCARVIYESLRPELEAFRCLPGVELVPRSAFTAWLKRQPTGNPHSVAP